MHSSKRNKLILTLAMLTGLSGCADYLTHRDSVTLGVGDAPAANSMIQTIDHYPRNASNTQIIVGQ